MLSKDIAELMKLIQTEEARATQKIKSDGPAVKGIVLRFLFCFFIHYLALFFGVLVFAANLNLLYCECIVSAIAFTSSKKKKKRIFSKKHRFSVQIRQ